MNSVRNAAKSRYAEIPIHSEIARYPLREANRALQDLKHGRVNGAAVLVMS